MDASAPAQEAVGLSRWRWWGRVTTSTLVALISLVGLTLSITRLAPVADRTDDGSYLVHSALRKDLASLSIKVDELTAQQSAYDEQINNPADVQQQLSDLRLVVAAGDYRAARAQSAELHATVEQWRTHLGKGLRLPPGVSYASVAAGASGPTLRVPILIYHYTPADFDQQLTALEQKGYETISLDQLSAALTASGPLPAKPVVITYDDGFANQWTAFDLLKRHNMKATFYIITGGEASNYCIGAGRHYGQSPACGDGYLSWDQIKQIDADPRMTIADHTVDHLALAIQTPEVQRFQIETARNELEQRLGHVIYHFAYPYGSFNATTIDILREEGFHTAVTTISGMDQSAGAILSMPRERDPYSLP